MSIVKFKFKQYQITDIYMSPRSPFAAHNTKSSKLRKKKLSLFQRGKRHCFYCKCKTQLSKSNSSFQGNEPYNLATLDHVYQKWDIRRALSKEMVLSCLNCNQRKNNIELEHLWEGYEYTGNDINILKLLQQTNK